MTTDLQIAVAKAMGWTYITITDYGSLEAVWYNPKGKVQSLPPLTLELMWDLESKLTDDEASDYTKELFRMAGGCAVWFVLHATAEQRAKAWLKVKGVGL